MKQSQRNPIANGFTLIEVVLAIALSAVLLGLLTLAVDQYLVNVQSSRETVEHAHVARGLLRLIADDLRNAATRYEQDTTAVEQLAAAAASSDFDPDSVDQPAEELQDSEVSAPRPPLGVSGDSTTLQIDVARSRRVAVAQPDEFVVEDAAPVFEGPPTASGISTVRYSLAPQGGLVRQEIAREIALYDDQQGVTTNWDAAYRVVAEEVVAVEFRYRNGADALQAWDLLQSEGENPLAVEVSLTLREPSQRDAEADPGAARKRRYRMTVGMPSIDDGVPADEPSTDPSAPGSASGDTSSSSGSSSR